MGQVGNSALMWAAVWGHYDICQYLLSEKGADADIVDSRGRKASELAQEKGFPALANLLRNYEKEE